MNIRKAIMEALRTDKCITRTDIGWIGYIKIKPTNSTDCCIFITEKSSAPRWNPTAEDLTSKNWIVL